MTLKIAILTACALSFTAALPVATASPRHESQHVLAAKVRKCTIDRYCTLDPWNPKKTCVICR